MTKFKMKDLMIAIHPTKEGNTEFYDNLFADAGIHYGECKSPTKKCWQATSCKYPPTSCPEPSKKKKKKKKSKESSISESNELYELKKALADLQEKMNY